MKREQAEQIARKHVDLRNKTEGHEDALSLSVAVNAIMEAVAIERETCAQKCLERHANGRFKHDTRDECADAIRAMGE